MVSQGVGGHEGYSGTPFWKIQQQNAAQREAALQESLAYVAERSKPVLPPNVLADAVSIGSGKPFARHVLIKCLRKVAMNARVDLPTTGVFGNQAPVGLYCLFDGQSAAGEPGTSAADYCARNFYKKVLENLASLPAGATSDTFVKATLVKSFEDLDREILDTQPDVRDGCGAAIALVVGEYLFTAVLGACDGTLCEAAGGRLKAVPLGRTQGRCHLPEERARLARSGGTVVGEGADARVVSPAGTSGVSRSLGDPLWKGVAGGPSVLSCIPEIHSTKLSWAETHLFLLLASKPLAEGMTSQQMVEASADFSAQPRAACGEIIEQALATKTISPTEQCTAVQVWFLKGGPFPPDADELAGAGEAAKKKARTAGPAVSVETKSARLRHILVKYQDGAKPPPGGKADSSRSKVEAEALLRKLLREFKAELEDLRRRFGRMKKAEELWQKSDKFIKLCKEHSVCPTAQKGGGMCGDLGWVSREAQRKLSKEFHDAVSVLRPGEWSDIVPSPEGLHIVQRIA